MVKGVVKKIVYVSAVERELFKNISIDSVWIYIGKRHKVQISDAGIFNQVKDHFDKIRKGPQFLAWLCETFSKVDQGIPSPQTISQWEGQVIVSEKPNVYTRLLRAIRLNNGYEFYGMVNDSGQLEYLEKTSDTGYPRVIINYLCFSHYANRVCVSENLDHPLDKSSAANAREINLCLRHGLIPVIPQIKVLSNVKGDNSLGYYDINSGNADAHTPAWDSFIGSLPDDGSRECFMAWVYSVFKDDNFGKQLLWLHGIGGSGKTKIAEAFTNKFKRINPMIVTNLEPLAFMDKFSSASYVKKRLTVSQDSTDRSMVKNRLIKNMTGGDNAATMKKGQDKDEASVYCKLLVTANDAPWLNPHKSEELERMLYIKVDPDLTIKNRAQWNIATQGEWAMQIDLEFDNFIAKCKPHYYNLLTPDNKNIQIYPTMVQKLTTNGFLTDNLAVWWACCIRRFNPTPEQKTNVLYYEELTKDYKRFLGARSKGNRYDISIQMCTLPFLLNLGIDVPRLVDTNNSLYIMDYEFIEEDPKFRSTLDEQLKKRAKEIGKSGKMAGVIYASKRNTESKNEES